MTRFKWTNSSVIKFAQGKDPVEAMEFRARNLALQAIDDGWSGPPFDPLALAERLSMSAEARSDIPDARTVPVSNGAFVLEYNPLRPRGRLRFSIAHEIAHTLFPDCAESIRNRGGKKQSASDEWQLEVLCNLGAAELLMPLGSFSQLAGETLTIRNVLELRKEFDVSVEACLIRLVKLSRIQTAAFCASMHNDGRYRVDYIIPSGGWESAVEVGQVIPADSVVKDVTAIGFTAIANETWGRGAALHVECVGLAPYPGTLNPRVVGLLVPQTPLSFQSRDVKELDGDALTPRGVGKRIIAHVIPDSLAMWGGGGFASQVRRRFPHVWQEYRSELGRSGQAPTLGKSFVGKLDDDTLIVHMVAQRGIGASHTQRLRYAALAECLAEVRNLAGTYGASVHMPRIGTGHGGANWEIVRELIVGELVDKGVETTIYQRPN